MECTWDTELLKCSELPTELLEIIQTGSNERYLEALTQTALDARYTYTLFAHCEDIFAHICASAREHGSFIHSLAIVARVLPFGPYLTPCAVTALRRESFAIDDCKDDDEMSLYLLSLLRLLRYNHRLFRDHVDSPALMRTLDKAGPVARYLIVRILQIDLQASDHWFETMLKRYLDDNADLHGPWDDRTIDYRFLTLWEEEQHEKSLQQISKAQSLAQSPHVTRRLRIIPMELFHTTTALLGGVLLPKYPNHKFQSNVTLVDTRTTNENLKALARALKKSQPTLLIGQTGSGKTLLIRHAAEAVGKLDSMVTLHLNEQSDAKLLLGVYTTGDTPGSFLWKPGVLTMAVQEGRWVLIEDIDRAPNEVLGVLLPLIEKRQLFLPNRKDTLFAAEGFRILATVRSARNHRGEETHPLNNMVGTRHWHRVSIAMPDPTEHGAIAQQLFPGLEKHLPGFLHTYQYLLDTQEKSSTRSKTGVARPISPRDLFKWCHRVSTLLRTGSEFTTAHQDAIYLESLDCFVGALPQDANRALLCAGIAQALQFTSPERRDYLIYSREVAYKAEKSQVTIGNYTIPKIPTSKAVETSFSTNPHTTRMLERVTAAVVNREPLLLVGETGVGKTTAVQHLASQLGKKLVPFNLSQQSEAGDLLGGFKPVNARTLMVPMQDEFNELYADTFNVTKTQRAENQRFADMLSKAMAQGRWKGVCKLWRHALKQVDQKRDSSPPPRDGEAPAKKQKTTSVPIINFAQWDNFAARVSNIERKLATSADAFAFTFVEGNIVKALRRGDWVLLDEINLASTDTLESIADMLDSASPSLLLTEAGNIERITAHPDFRVFAAMNPATDVGKKDLPAGIRSRFTELYVESPDKDTKSLQSIVKSYLRQECSRDPAIAANVATLYQRIIALAEDNRLVDGAGQKPHFSLRTLTRTLTFAKDTQQMCNIRRALYEGFQMSFMTFLDVESAGLVEPLLKDNLFRKGTNVATELKKPLQKPQDGRSYVQGHPQSKHWLRQGKNAPQQQEHYIITPFVEHNLENLVRAASTRRFPVLIQGPTSSGKTSMIEYLAKRTGHQFTRINNHEHTDLQEYLGTYISGTDGKLQFQEGVLVKALREGHWLVLDELNLAPTDVLEALNRLLDDNRELLIPETQETVHPHPDFMLFATQNPAGLYGGRKTLSRAFRNRFLELHFDDIPVNELQEILHKRTQLPESRCKRIVNVYKELAILRQENRLFEQKSFATLRDLFRWAMRPNDTIEQLATNGYMLLCERVRKPEERTALKSVLERVMGANGPKVRIDEEALYAETAPEIEQHRLNASDQGVVWTRAMRRLYVLVSRAIANNEPVLLVGETGCGKTTVCQMLAEAVKKQLHMVNAHQNTETGDLIGSQRPMRNRAAIEAKLKEKLLNSPNMRVSVHGALHTMESLLAGYDQSIAKATDEQKAKHFASSTHAEIQTLRTRHRALFEWADGSLVHAMRTGEFFLLDEISLADDSVLERINSVLEASRTILLAEKGSLDSAVTAAHGFQFFATMNPGGDYGKRELSPALRNRFTEIWVPALSDMDDVLQIVRAKLTTKAHPYAESMVAFASWFKRRFDTSSSASISIRDTLAWIDFVNSYATLDATAAVVHGAAMVYIDTLGANPAGLMTLASNDPSEERQACLNELGRVLKVDISSIYGHTFDVTFTETKFAIGPFSLDRTDQHFDDLGFSFEPPTTRSNAMRVVRALQLPKPIMLEGSPGVGKTTLVAALAKAAGIPLTRINLSDQTDLVDLFGSDAPMEGAQTGTFVWRDAPFLRAMKAGEWVLLDEMNLASQSVLEGLNACLDHRGEVFVPELGQSFSRHPSFRLFAAQNPHHQGGGRKGLPASFVNRFTVVYADSLKHEDLLLICASKFPNLHRDYLLKAVSFTTMLNAEVERKSFGALGSPWEFNLRDIERWLTLASSTSGLLQAGTAKDFVKSLFVQRFRSLADRLCVDTLFEKVFGSINTSDVFCSLSTHTLQVGLALLPRHSLEAPPQDLHILSSANTAIQIQVLQTIMLSVQQSWPIVLTGSAGVGKTKLIERLAACVGAEVVTLPMNAETDALDLIGGYEQADPHRRFTEAMRSIRDQVDGICKIAAAEGQMTSAAMLKHALSSLTTDPTTHQQLLQRLPAESRTSIERSLGMLTDSSRTIDKARFEWIDGPLIEVLQQGKWLVLDNANLCSPAVLDRLNSLLEPNGGLVVNEHCNADGEARVVSPHRDFRVFLTVDPRVGELSRAMRNRAVELFIETGQDEQSVSTDGLRTESAISRFQALKAAESANALAIAFDHVGLVDLPILPSFRRELDAGLFGDAHGFVSGSSDMSTLTGRSALLQSFYSQAASHMRVPTDYASVQTLHPLNNQPLVQQSREAFTGAMLSAAQHDLGGEYQQCAQAVEQLARDRKVSDRLSKFWRKAKQQMGITTKSSNNAIVEVLQELLSPIAIWLQERLSSSDLDQLVALKNALLKVLSFIETFVEHLSHDTLDHATFMACIATGHSTIETCTAIADAGLINSPLRKSLAMLTPPSSTKGTGYKALWSALRPNMPTSIEQLQALLNFEVIVERFDQAAADFQLPLDQIVELRAAFQQTLSLSSSTTSDFESLAKMTNDLIPEQQLEQDEFSSTSIKPHFEGSFERICQQLALLSMYHNNIITPDVTTLEVLARRATKHSISQVNDLAEVHKLLRLLQLSSTALVHESENETGTVSSSIIHQLSASDSVTLRDMPMLDAETHHLGEVVASKGHLLQLDELPVLGDCLECLVQYVRDIGLALPSSLGTAFSGMNANMQARAWATFAIAGLDLFVAEQLFDPVQEAAMLISVHERAKSELQSRLTALSRFRLAWVGDSDSLRGRLLQQDIVALGPAPEAVQICRPRSSQLSELHSELQALMRVVGALRQRDDFDMVDRGTWDNMAVIRSRLSGQYRAYADITTPVLGFVDCLLVARRLSLRAQHEASSQTSVLSCSMLTPLIEADINTFLSEKHLLGARAACKSKEEQMYWLSAVAVQRSVAGATPMPETLQRAISETFSNFYEAWKIELGQEQKIAQAKSSLFKYRGGDDDSEEVEQAQLDELFPTYEESGNTSAGLQGTSTKAQDLAPRLAELYHAVNNPGHVTSEMLFDLIQGYARLSPMSSTNGQDNNFVAVLYGLQSLASKLAVSQPQARRANIYTDANIAQSRSLLNLVKKVQQRFGSIHQAYPEQATPIEVLRVCEQIQTLGHTEPLVRYLPTVEKLHATINEWQKLGRPAVDSAAAVLEETIQLIVSWRKLELSTWAGMFDFEDEQCQHSAASWWYIAYETIVLASEDMIKRPEDAETFRRQLTQTLGDFLMNCGLGEYNYRLQLLRDFETALTARAIHESAYTIVRDALANVILFYSRFEATVNDQLSQRRAKLEKDIQNVIQVASWKDFNIEALRKSAKASHNKLFRVVRKYRQLLAEPVAALVQADFATIKYEQGTANAVQILVSHRASDLDLLANTKSPWLLPYSRLPDSPSKIAREVIDTANNDTTVSAANRVQRFMVGLAAEIDELKKATSDAAAKDNKEMIKHLKQPKRVLLAKTFRKVQSMGYQTNVSEDILHEQDSLHLTLARTAPLALHSSSDYAQDADQEFHRLLHIMPRVRDSIVKHNEDLTPAEVARAKALLESMLQVCCQQQSTLGEQIASVSALQHSLDELKGFASSQGLAVGAKDNFKASTTMLSAVLEAACQCVEYQSRLGDKDYGPVLEQLRSYSIAGVGRLNEDLAALPTMPDGIVDAGFQALQIRYQEQIAPSIQRIVAQGIEAHPELAPVLSHVEKWLPSAASQQEASQQTSVVGSLRTLFEDLWQLLGTVQKPQPQGSSHGQPEKRWLVEQLQQQQSVLQALRLAELSKHLSRLSNALAGSSDADGSLDQLAALLRTVFLPILDAHLQSSRRTIENACKLHASNARLAYRLASSFIQLNRDGFCQPSDKQQSDEKQSGQAETGTGLGDGEGGEDISKDVNDDEDLSELAQDATSKDKEGDTEAEKDAVDMADEDLEGKFDEDAGSEDEDEEGREGDEADNDVDEEAGQVNEDDAPVDEKTWNDEGKNGEADKEADKGKGQKSEDISAAGEEAKDAVAESAEDSEDDQQKDGDAETGADDDNDEEGAPPAQTEEADPHMQDEPVLDLPEDINMDGDGGKDDVSELSDDADQFDDIDEASEEDNQQRQDDGDVEMGNEEADEEAQENGEATAQDQDEQAQDPEDDAASDIAMLDRQDGEDQHEDIAPAEAGAGQDQQQDNSLRNTGALSSAEQTEQENDIEQAIGQDGTAEGGSRRQADTVDGQAQPSEQDEKSLPYKQLGDVLKQWYEQHRNIEAAKEDSYDAQDTQENQPNMDDARFEHTDNAEVEMQALGAADADQSRALDKDNAMHIEQEEDNPGEAQELESAGQEPEQDGENAEGGSTNEKGTDASRQDKAVVGKPTDPDTSMQDDVQMSDSQEMDDVDEQLTATHLDATQQHDMISIEEAHRAWSEHENRTRNMAIVLTEHLRLILHPTQATKMRGDFRTGKRLNIKKIIPYIASSYKRDKIWMRRSVPSKRSYQIMLAIDDSESMNEAERKGLAFDTLALVAKALSMLEAGELSIVGFGNNVNVVHEFNMPFTSDTGAEVFRQLTFTQTKTDVRKLLEKSIELFRTARLKASGSASDLWQLQLIISDGQCEDHPSIRQLVRQAHEEQIMVVFIIVDAAAPATGSADKKGSIMDLQEARFTTVNGEAELEMVRYLDHFPFQYYLIVRDVQELPNVLAGALRQWFSEVVESG